MNIFLIVLFLGVFFALTWRKIEYGIVILLAALPLYIVRFSIFGLPSTLLEGMILVLFCVWLIRRPQEIRRNIQILRMNKIFIGIISLFLFSSLVSVYISHNIYAALGLWRAYIFEPLLFFVVWIDTIHTKKHILWVCSASIISGCSIALYGIFQRITGLGIPQEWIIERRITSIFPYPNAVGLYLAPILVLAIVLLVWQVSTYARDIKKQSIIVIISGAVGVLLTAIVFAKTEAALVALFVSGVSWSFFWSAKSRRGAVALCMCMIFFIVISPSLAKILDEKLFFKDWSGLVRKSIWRETIPMIKDNWILGAGFSGYQKKMEPYHKDTFTEIYKYPHTILLNFWSEMGLFGLIVFEVLVGWYFFILVRIVRTLRKIPQGDEKGFLRALAFGCFFAMMTIVIHGFVDVPYFKNDLAVFFWMLIGLVMVVHTHTQKMYHFRLSTIDERKSSD